MYIRFRHVYMLHVCSYVSEDVQTALVLKGKEKACSKRREQALMTFQYRVIYLGHARPGQS